MPIQQKDEIDHNGDDDRGENQRRAFRCGLAGGASFAAKHGQAGTLRLAAKHGQAGTLRLAAKHRQTGSAGGTRVAAQDRQAGGLGHLWRGDDLDLGMEDHAERNDADHDEEGERRDAAESGGQTRQGQREQQGNDENHAIGRVGHEALHHAEVEGREHVGDQVDVEGAEQGSDRAAPAAGQAGAAEHQGGHRHQRVGGSLGRIAGADERSEGQGGQGGVNARDGVRPQADDIDSNAAGIGGPLVGPPSTASVRKMRCASERTRRPSPAPGWLGPARIWTCPAPRTSSTRVRHRRAVAG